MSFRLGVAAVVTCAAVLVPAVSAVAAEPAATVSAQGNPFSGGLAFVPRALEVRVGDTVRWTNTDNAVPHTATEDHGLWNLTGDYGQTPANPPGFGPGESRERVFEAGVHHYFCQVHPEMKGFVSVPPLVGHFTRRRRGGRRVAFVTARWAVGAPAEGQAYDVQRRRTGRQWRDWITGTREAEGRFRAGRPGRRWQVRARLRSLADPNATTNWSPRGKVTT